MISERVLVWFTQLCCISHRRSDTTGSTTEEKNEYSDGKRSTHRETRQIELCIFEIQDAPIPCWSRLLKLIEGAHENQPNPTHANYPAWEQAMRANTVACKLQLQHELNNIQQRDMSITSYTLKIKELCDVLRSINVIINDDEMVQICLDGLAPRFDIISVAILAREKPPSFFDSILLVEENHIRSRSNVSDGQMLYSQ